MPKCEKRKKRLLNRAKRKRVKRKKKLSLFKGPNNGQPDYVLVRGCYILPDSPSSCKKKKSLKVRAANCDLITFSGLPARPSCST